MSFEGLSFFIFVLRINYYSIELTVFSKNKKTPFLFVSCKAFFRFLSLVLTSYSWLVLFLSQLLTLPLSLSLSLSLPCTIYKGPKIEFPFRCSETIEGAQGNKQSLLLNLCGLELVQKEILIAKGFFSFSIFVAYLIRNKYTHILP